MLACYLLQRSTCTFFGKPCEHALHRSGLAKVVHRTERPLGGRSAAQNSLKLIYCTRDLKVSCALQVCTVRISASEASFKSWICHHVAGVGSGCAARRACWHGRGSTAFDQSAGDSKYQQVLAQAWTIGWPQPDGIVQSFCIDHTAQPALNRLRVVHHGV